MVRTGCVPYDCLTVRAFVGPADDLHLVVANGDLIELLTARGRVLAGEDQAVHSDSLSPFQRHLTPPNGQAQQAGSIAMADCLEKPE